jgi:hypothetical protein
MKFSQNPVAPRSCQITFDFFPVLRIVSHDPAWAISRMSAAFSRRTFPGKTQGLGCDLL